MNAKLQRVEVQPARPGDDDLTIEYAAWRKLLQQGCDNLWEVAIQGLSVATLYLDVVAVAKDDSPKPIPLGLEDPPWFLRHLRDPLCEHGQDGRIDGEIHVITLNGHAPVGQKELKDGPALAGRVGTADPQATAVTVDDL